VCQPAIGLSPAYSRRGSWERRPKPFKAGPEAFLLQQPASLSFSLFILRFADMAGVFPGSIPFVNQFYSKKSLFAAHELTRRSPRQKLTCLAKARRPLLWNCSVKMFSKTQELRGFRERWLRILWKHHLLASLSIKFMASTVWPLAK
jgi:hypothetical protein